MVPFGSDNREKTKPANAFRKASRLLGAESGDYYFGGIVYRREFSGMQPGPSEIYNTAADPALDSNPIDLEKHLIQYLQQLPSNYKGVINKVQEIVGSFDNNEKSGFIKTQHQTFDFAKTLLFNLCVFAYLQDKAYDNLYGSNTSETQYYKKFQDHMIDDLLEILIGVNTPRFVMMPLEKQATLIHDAWVLKYFYSYDGTNLNNGRKECNVGSPQHDLLTDFKNLYNSKNDETTKTECVRYNFEVNYSKEFFTFPKKRVP